MPSTWDSDKRTSLRRALISLPLFSQIGHETFSRAQKGFWFELDESLPERERFFQEQRHVVGDPSPSPTSARSASWSARDIDRNVALLLAVKLEPE